MSRERLLDAAYCIVLEESLSDLSIDHLTERAGLSRRTFFLHFSSKDQLLAEMLENLRPFYAAQYAEWAESLDPGLPPEERIMAMMRKLVDAIRDPSWRGCCFVRISAEFGERPGHPVHAAVAGANGDFAQWIEAQLGKGQFRSPGLLAKQLLVAINGLLILQLVHRESGYGDAMLQMVSTLLAAAKSGREPRSVRANRSTCETFQAPD